MTFVGLGILFMALSIILFDQVPPGPLIARGAVFATLGALCVLITVVLVHVEVSAFTLFRPWFYRNPRDTTAERESDDRTEQTAA